MALRDALLPEFDMEMASTRKTLERVPEDKFGWKPHDKSFSMGHLASHLANLPSWAVFSLPKAAVLRTWVMNHNVHHRAQLGVYLRLNDVPVPSVYGPSADEQGM